MLESIDIVERSIPPAVRRDRQRMLESIDIVERSIPMVHQFNF